MPLKLVPPRKGRTQCWYIRGSVAGVHINETTGTSCAEDAERYKARREHEIWERRHFGERGQRTFGEAITVYLGDRAIGESFRATLRRLAPHFRNHRLAEIDQAAIDAYIRRHHAGAAPATILRQVITPITAVMTAAAKRGWCDRPTFARPKPPRGRMRHLTEAEAERLITAAHNHLRHLIVFLLHTGARLGEALHLDWREVDLINRRVAFLETKNGTSRGVPLNDAAFLALANLPHREGRVFLTPKGKPYYDSGVGGSPIKTGFRNACRRAGLVDQDGQPSVRVHDLRHTFASWLAMRGAPLRTIAELMGHKTLTMVMRYSHLCPDHLSGAVAMLDGGKSVELKNKKSTSA